jgi:hypothetical protein
MDIGYSLLLREFITAVEVDYGDCQQFQITCPCCHEAIYKAGKYGQDRQYFSHYAASKSDVSECELRVAALSRETIEAKNIIGHGQSMEKFFATSQDFVLNWLFREQAKATRIRINWMVARPAFTSYALHLRKVVRSREQTHRVLLRKLIADLLIVPQSSDFWFQRQTDFASDFIDHLIAPNSSALFVFFIAVSILLTRPINVKDAAFTHGRDRVLQHYIDNLSDDMFHNVNTWYLRTFDFLLVTLPYVDLLAGHSDETANRDLLLVTIEQITRY